MEQDEKRLEELLEEANVNYAQRAEFRHDVPRAIALLEHALKRRAVEKPAAYALARFRRGEFPTRTNGRDRSRPSTAYERVHRIIKGQGWDDSYSTADMLEEIEDAYLKRGERLSDRDRAALLLAWQTEQLRRFPAEPALVEWAAPPPEWADLEPSLGF